MVARSSVSSVFKVCAAASITAIGGKSAGLLAGLFTAVFISPLLSFHLTASVFSCWAQSKTSSSNVLQIPQRQEVFSEDLDKEEKALKKTKQSIISADQAASANLDFQAPQVDYDRESTVIRGSGGVVISNAGMIVQADSGALNTTTQQAELEGDVVVTDAQAVLRAQSGEFNLESETGDFQNARVIIEESDFNVRANKLSKVEELRYELIDSSLTSCSCLADQDGSEAKEGQDAADEYQPWFIRSKQCSITREGYAHTYNTSVDLFGVPVLYTPYLGFPVKSERASGLLVPSFGYSDKHGTMFQQPLFVVLDDHTDLTFSPFVETQSRYGTGLDFRKTFSREHQIEGRFIYSNERERDGHLQGTEISNLFDAQDCAARGISPEDCGLFDEDRFGAYYSQQWRSGASVEVPSTFVADVHLVSDDLFLREMEYGDLGEREARYTTSTAALSSSFGDWGFLAARAEYNQSFETDDDIVFQRVPDAAFEISRTLRPFGYNPLGLKLVTKGVLASTLFARDAGYDGVRTNLAPSVSMPFHYKNYFSSALAVGLNQTYYNLSENAFPDGSDSLEDSESRTLPTFSYTTLTTLEKVYDISPDGWLATLTSLGRNNQDLLLRRIKHEITPFAAYTYVPDTTQDRNPFFDAFDRVRQKSLFAYGVSTSLLGRALPRSASSSVISEVEPRLQDLPTAGSGQPLFDIGGLDEITGGGSSSRLGEIRKLADFSILQTFDYFEDTEDADPNRRAFSDIALGLGVYPGSSFGLNFGTNFNQEDNELSSWNMLTNFYSDRGDLLRARFTYIRDSLSQIEGNLEVVLTDRWKVGWYSRYNDLGLQFNREGPGFLENQVALRLKSACDCWAFDVGYSDTLNPDRKYVLFRFTFGGLGDIAQDFRYGKKHNQQ